MFSKDILKQDVQTISVLKQQRDNCKKLISSGIRDLITSDNISPILINEEKTTMSALYDQLLDLEQQISVLEEQMFLNYINPRSFDQTTPKNPGTSFPHFDTIIS